MMKGIAAPVETAYPKGTDTPALYPWRHAGTGEAGNLLVY